MIATNKSLTSNQRSIKTPSGIAVTTTGATTVNSWVTAIGTTVNSNPSLTSGRLINLNHQVQIILRVITRDMDAAARLRPDNLQA